ncbi:MAG TPA: alpha-L-fucosidase [Phycisphaerales bacterium]|nr:alpha-L-fucosidase [Phycisphaerales bacterium]HMP35986.1 alpha-L-fucosidase [Phycisphaerales bacterium]
MLAPIDTLALFCAAASLAAPTHALAASGAGAAAPQVVDRAAAAAVPRDDDRDERMGWWRDARFGLFIHWGLYAIPAGRWGERSDYGEWIRHSARIPVDVYDRFLPEFNPFAFDADEWMRLAADAGMKYVVITTKHHDGFCLFDSALTEFDIASAPRSDDIMQAIADAARRHDLVPCWYHSIMDWHHPDYLPRRGWEAESRPAAGADFDRYERYLHGQVAELLTSYGPIGVMWFDGEWEETWTHERGVRLYELCRRLQPSVIVNNRVDKGRNDMAGLTREGAWRGDFGTPEQQVPPRGLPGVDWESCITMNSHWGWNEADRAWKSGDDLIRMLSDIVSKGGNFLLNVGPKADGTFPPEAVERLREIGAWMAVNGEAIHGTQASPFERLDFGRATWKPRRAEVRATEGGGAGASGRGTAGVDGGTLYIHVFEWPEDGRLRLPGLVAEPSAARILGQERATVDALRSEGGLLLSARGAAPRSAVTVIALELDAAPTVLNEPRFDPDGGLFVGAVTLRPAGGAPAVPGATLRYTLDGGAPGPDSPVFPGSLRLDATGTITARWFLGDGAVGDPSSTTWTRAEPRQGVALPAGAAPGLDCTISYGSTRRLRGDGAAALPIDRVERSAGFAIPASEARRERVRLDFAGFLRIDEPGLYEFAVTSDDGSLLFVGDELVVDNDGLHGPHEVRGRIALGAGWHPVALALFNGTGGFLLEVGLAKAGETPVPIDPERLRSLVAPR